MKDMGKNKMVEKMIEMAATKKAVNKEPLHKKLGSKKIVVKKEKSSRERMRDDFEYLYQEALARENLSIALKVKELQAKEMGFFTPATQPLLNLKDLSDQELEQILAQLTLHN